MNEYKLFEIQLTLDLFYINYRHVIICGLFLIVLSCFALLPDSTFRSFSRACSHTHTLQIRYFKSFDKLKDVNSISMYSK